MPGFETEVGRQAMPRLQFVLSSCSHCRFRSFCPGLTALDREPRRPRSVHAQVLLSLPRTSCSPLGVLLGVGAGFLWDSFRAPGDEDNV